MNASILILFFMLTSCASIKRYGNTEVFSFYKDHQSKNKEKVLVQGRNKSTLCLPDDQEVKEGDTFATGTVYDKKELLKSLYFEKAKLDISNHLVNTDRDIEVKATSDEILKLDIFFCYEHGWSLFEVDANDFLYVTYRYRKP